MEGEGKRDFKETMKKTSKTRRGVRKIDVKCAINYEHAKVIYKVKVVNNTESAISDIRVKQFIPKVLFIADKEELIIPLLRPKHSCTVTFVLRPKGECGNVQISGKVVYYDSKLDKYRAIDIKPKPTSIICPMLKVQEITELEWRTILEKLVSIDETIKEVPLSIKELFNIVSGVIRDMNMFMLEPEISKNRHVGRFYCEGIKGLKYAVQIEVIGGMQRSKLLLKAYTENQKSLIGFYHKILDEIEERIEIKDYIKNSLVIHGDYIEGDKTEIKDSIIYRSSLE